LREPALLLRQRYGVDAEVATFPPNTWFTPEELGGANRSRIRANLGIPEEIFAISSFGFVSHSKGVVPCIIALEILRSWNIPAELFLVGDPALVKSVPEGVASKLGVLDYLHLSKEFVPPERYRNFMIASDAAIQLRTYDFGQPSAGLVDCISAGLPTVAGCSLADACNAPSYVARIPDHTSALLLAERLAEIWERGPASRKTEEERALYCQLHSFEQYAVRLKEIMNL
jgi:glycosyltransferase involved in cell wall biosynthesis